ncbi:aldo/keto reductase [Verrucomicrobia bacterium]|nr:aldo/keto reductase [Verrucomicrobiota bacterium]
MNSLKLITGDELPSIGAGFWKVDNADTARVTKEAIEMGYRHLDCACDYGNESEVGQGIADAISSGLCKREDLWVTSKLWNTYHAAEHVRSACEKSLKDLGLDCLDLYLVHFPISQKHVAIEERYPPGWFFDPEAESPKVELAPVPLSETWAAMEQLVKDGLVKNIGVCNVGTAQLQDMLNYATVPPSVLQVETHPYLTQEKLLRFCNEKQIAYTAFSPLGAQSYFAINMAEAHEGLMEHAVVKEIATVISKTPAQVLLRWGVQRGTAIVPKSSNKGRLQENLGIFDFELSEDQMAALTALNMNRRFNDPGDFGEAAFNTFLPIYE